uniref:non-specific serine/threonine protein kinase n=1 Tax=Cacopsylla melanoneura TaxID=428564 RepID=A0A8D9AEC6_9HEMI
MGTSAVKFIDKLPNKARNELCNILDRNNDWKILGGTLDFKIHELAQMENAILRRGSPTDELLSKMATRNHRVSDLFKHLYKIEHFQAMLILKPYVNPRYHKLLPAIDSNDTSGTTLEDDLANIKVQDEALPKQENNQDNQIERVLCIPGIHDQPTVELCPPGNHPTREVWDPLGSTHLNMIGCIPRIPYDELRDATDNWKIELGSGGFGKVYKGLWKKSHIAIKVLKVKRQNKPEEELNQIQREQSLRELKYLSSCRHDNILPLYGICFEAGKYCLIYQYMKNGSLEDRLHMKNYTLPLHWKQRLNIARGSALGLQFLHDREPPLIHGDIKSANILLNAYMDPVIGDFGLTREGPIERATHVTLSRVSGTRPYLPYEYLMDKILSTKVDVYAFGIVLFELATGMGPYDSTRKRDGKFLRDFVLIHAAENRDMQGIVDKIPGLYNVSIADIFFNIGKLCVSLDRKDRPEMSQVCTYLRAGSDQSDDDYEFPIPTLPTRPARPAPLIPAPPIIPTAPPAPPIIPTAPPAPPIIPTAPIAQRNQFTDEFLFPRT